MKTACEMQDSGLMTCFVGSKTKLELACFAARKWCTEKLNMPDPVVCEIANYLNSQCKVIGGNAQALDFVELNYKEFGINRIKRLAVSGAFHTRLMESCEQPLFDALKRVHVKKPAIKFYSNVNGELCTNESKIKRNLVKQLSSPVKWEQILNNFYIDENLPTNSAELAQKQAELDEREKEKLSQKVEKEAVKDFLNTAISPPTPDTKTDETEAKIGALKKQIKKLQSANREYPDIYECGPGSVTGPLLRLINAKAHRFYKHIDVWFVV